MKHTKEPWHVCDPTEQIHAVRAETGRIVADVGYSDTDAQNRMNARRIVACVNACAGVTTEELEQGGFVTGLIERLEEKERQRDALQEELENIATAAWRELEMILRTIRSKHGAGIIALPEADVTRIDAALNRGEGQA